MLKIDIYKAGDYWYTKWKIIRALPIFQGRNMPDRRNYGNDE